MGKRIKGILVEPRTDKNVSGIISLYSDTFLQQLYEKLNCNTVEVIYRKICNIDVEIWVDEDGKLKNNQILVATGYRDGKKVEHLVGNIFICATSVKGSSMSLTDEQIMTILIELRSNYRLEYEV